MSVEGRNLNWFAVCGNSHQSRVELIWVYKYEVSSSSTTNTVNCLMGGNLVKFILDTLVFRLPAHFGSEWVLFRVTVQSYCTLTSR